MTKVKRESFDKDLQSYYWTGKTFTFLLTRIWGIKTANVLLNFISDNKLKKVQKEKKLIKSLSGGPDIPVYIYKPLNNTNEPLPVLLYIHGGGYIIGSPEITQQIENFILTRPCVIVSPQYRKALTAPYPAALNDCYDTLLWIKEHANEIGGMGNNIMIAGHSAGGGLTAAVTLKNRDQKDIDVAFQMPIYPMLDYRNMTESALTYTDVPVWNTKINKYAWRLYLKGLIDNNISIPVYASPALNTDYSNLPPTITFAGEFEPFKDEIIQYVDSLKQAGIPVKYKLFKKAFHSFDTLVTKAEISKQANQFLFDSYAEFYDNSYNTKK
jgi:acetyl esterase/lipase